MRLTAAAGLLVTILAASGCAEAPPETTSNDDPVLAVAGAPAVPTTEVAASAPASADSDLSNWSLNASMGDLALEIVFDVPADAECTARFGATMAVERTGPYRIYWFGVDGGSGWGAASFADVAHAHAEGVVDSREVLGPTSAYAMTEIQLGLREGRTEFGLFLRGVETLADFPAEYRWFEGEGRPSTYFQVDCEEPTDVVQRLSAGREVIMENAESMAGGAGASAFFVGSATVDDSVEERFEAPRTFAMLGSFGYQAGNFELSHPEGTETWLLAPTGLSPATYSYEGGPGEYRGTLTRAGGYFEAFWFAMAGFHEVQGPQEILLLPQPAG